MAIYLRYVVAKAGVKQVSHFTQLIQTGKFRQYDYKNLNQNYYKNNTPPDYLLEEINAPLYVYHASEDLLTSEIVSHPD